MYAKIIAIGDIKHGRSDIQGLLLEVKDFETLRRISKHFGEEVEISWVPVPKEEQGALV